MPVIELKGENAEYHADVLKKMIDEANIRDKEVYVIAISGVYRSGKSFFLNLLNTYMDYYSKVGLKASAYYYIVLTVYCNKKTSANAGLDS